MSDDAFHASPRNRQASALGWFVLFLQHMSKMHRPWWEQGYFEHIETAHRLMLEA